MKLSRTTACNLLEIKEPRWKDKSLPTGITVLLADWKIGTHNEIRITKRNKAGDLYFPEPFYMSGEQIRTYPTQNHASRSVYIVPVKDLQMLERIENEN